MSFFFFVAGEFRADFSLNDGKGNKTHFLIVRD